MHFFAPTHTASDVYTSINSHVTAAMWTHTNNFVQVTEVDVIPLDGTSLTSINATGAPAKWSGAQTSGDTILQVAALIKLQTSIRGRSYRGRLFLPLVSELATANGTLGGSVQTAMTTAWQTFQAATGADGINLAVASYKLAVATEVSVVSCESVVATQRRRVGR